MAARFTVLRRRLRVWFFLFFSLVLLSGRGLSFTTRYDGRHTPQATSIIRLPRKDFDSFRCKHHGAGSTLLSTAPDKASEVLTSTKQEDQRTKCKHCSTVFSTRNALFRHLRTDPTCSLKENTDYVEMVKESVAFLFGYIGTSKEESSDDRFSTAEKTGKVLEETIIEALDEVVKSAFNTSKCEVELISTAQASLAKLRHRALNQENDCSAAGDVLVTRVTVPSLMNSSLWSLVVQGIRERLTDGIHLFSCELLVDGKIHAERSCTQRVYHYLLPLSWLPNGNDLQEWWRSEDAPLQDHHVSKKLQKPPDSLRRFKAALRSAECTKKSQQDIKLDVNRTFRVAAGRFGALGARQRLPWHNFADPRLLGDASPNNEPVWRVVDRARILDFLEDGRGDINAIIEIRGDDFLKQQVRRVVGTALAITHGWLPTDFFDIVRRDDTVVETPLAPSGRLYLASVRFHFDEMLFDGLPLFTRHKKRRIIESTPIQQSYSWIQKELLYLKLSNSATAAEESWLTNLKMVTSPRIRKQLEQRDQVLIPYARSSNLYTESYNDVLTKLRQIAGSGMWPETSSARSNVIRDVRDQDKKRSGSFTVVNPNVEENWEALPLGNTIFPDLVEAVFKLEKVLAHEPVDRVTTDNVEYQVKLKRPPSSHCAINCCAEFTPHVDSGTGAGQSLSMIVGLGEYAGGELFVEGQPFDIQYKAIEFDGWKLRHWTNRFHGERFSLVWFTPESKGN